MRRHHRLQAVGGRIDIEAAHAKAAGEELAFVVIILDDERSMVRARLPDRVEAQ